MLRIIPLFAIMVLATQTSAQPSSDILLVANQGDHTISLIDPASGNLVKTIATHGDHTHEIRGLA
jgi:hypothetical protein